MRVVLDTCILKLATFPAENNASALIFELARAGLIEAWVSPVLNVPEVGRLIRKLIEADPAVAPAIHFAGALVHVKGPLRRCAPLTRQARSRVG